MSNTVSDVEGARGDDPRRVRSRRAGLLLLLLLLVLAGVTWWNWDRIAYGVATRFGIGGGPGTVEVPPYVPAQGAQDAPRAEVMTNRIHDYETCMETLRLRRVPHDTADDTCRKMVQGLYGR